MTSIAEDRKPIPSDIAAPALSLIGEFEAGGGADPWINVNSTDELSIGFMQWNWNTEGLQRFLGNAPDEAVELVDGSLREDLDAFRRAYNEGDTAGMRGVLTSWKTRTPNDPVQGGVRRSIKSQLQAWLGTDEMRAYQLSKIEPTLKRSYSFARRWAADSGETDANLSFLTAYFFDLETYNGGRAGLWYPHVEALRGQLGDDKAVVTFVTEWMEKCLAYSFDGDRKFTTLYGAEDTKDNIKHWRLLAKTRTFDPIQIDLLLLGYLRATLSNGDDKPRGFHGIFEADVLNRRGVVALGSGKVHGKTYRGLFAD